jgi:hypothetical protein
MTVLLPSVEHGEDDADPMLARIAMTRALNVDRDMASEMSAANMSAMPRRKGSETLHDRAVNRRRSRQHSSTIHV